LLQVSRFQFFLQRKGLHVRIQRGQGSLRGRHFGRTDGIGAIEDLALQVGEVDLVGIGDRQFADAARRKVERGRAPQAAGADDQRVRRAQPLLALDPDLIEEDVAAVAEELLVVQVVKPGVKAGAKISSSSSRPAWSAPPRAAAP
jgi:hypothetical protein